MSDTAVSRRGKQFSMVLRANLHI